MLIFQDLYIIDKSFDEKNPSNQELLFTNMSPTPHKKADGKVEKSSTKGEKSIGKDKSNPSAKNKIEHHQSKSEELKKEKETLLAARDQGTLTEEDEEKLRDIEDKLRVYETAASQQNVTSTRKIEPIQIQNKSDHESDHESDNESVYTKEPTVTTTSEDTEMKQEPDEELKPQTGRLLDDLNMEWDVDLNKSYGESSLQNIPKDAFGHIVRNSRTRYCIRYGSGDARSARFESVLPNESKYSAQRDVTQSRNRIVEKIVQLPVSQLKACLQ